MRPFLRSALLAVALAGAVRASALLQTPALEEVLRLAGDYMNRYERDVTAVVAQEVYVQSIPKERRSRRLTSELVMVADERDGWIEFRDVFDVDGQSVRDRDERIVQLFLKPNPNAFARAKQIVDESARFNISPAQLRFNRTLNVPLTGLRFLRAQNQARSTWTLGRDDLAGRRVHVVRFQEHALPRLIASNENSAANGTFWIEPATGAVVRTELRMSHARVSATINVDFAEHPTIKLWLPATMKETYTIQTRALFATAIHGDATYSNYRQFQVQTSVTVK